MRIHRVLRAMALPAIFLATIAACDATAGVALSPGSGVAPSPDAIPSRGSTASPTGPAAPLAGPSATANASPIVVGPGEAWIVYQGGTGGPPRIRLVRPDGTDDHELTPGSVPGAQYHPDWSPDGSRIALVAEGDDGVRDLWISNVDGSDAHRLLECTAPCTQTDDPAWSPDGRRIAFDQFTARGNDGLGVGEIRIIDVGTGTVQTAITGEDTEYLYVPRWAPDGKRLVIENDRFATALLDEERVVASTVGIVVLDSAKARFQPLLPWASLATYPDWSPAADRIVFQRPTVATVGSDPADIWTIAVDGSDARQASMFGADGGWGIQPTWTPDGSRIMFVGEDIVRTHPNVATVLPDGTGLTRLSDDFIRTHPRLRPSP